MESGNTNAHRSASDASSPTGECSSRSSKTAQLRGPSGKLLVEVWSNGQIVGPNASNFKTAIGNEVRLHIPINTKDWRLVKDSFKDAIWKALTKEYEFNVSNFAARPWVETNYPQKLRTVKATYRSKFLANSESIEAAKANCPPGVNPTLWVDFVDYELQPKVKERNAKNANNRAMNDIGTTNGRKTFSQIHKELQEQNPQAKRTRVDDWCKGRERRDGSVLPSAQEKYDQVKAVQKRRLASGETDIEDIDSDALTEVLGKEKKNRVRGVGSNITRKQLQHAAVANDLINQMATTSVAKVEADMASFKSKVDGDMSEVKSMLKVLIQQQLCNNNVTANAEAHMGVTTPRTELGSNSAQRHSPATPQNLTPAFGSLEQPRVTLLDKFGAEVAKGSVDVGATICHGRILFGGERRVYIDEVLVPDAAVYDGPQDGNATLNAWVEGGYIAWLDGRLKYD